jgi:hypothetical protein
MSERVWPGSWYWLAKPSQRAAHYFENGMAVSLCGRVVRNSLAIAYHEGVKCKTCDARAKADQGGDR